MKTERKFRFFMVATGRSLGSDPIHQLQNVFFLIVITAGCNRGINSPTGGEFFPFGCTMSADGEIAHSAGWTGAEQPTSAEVIELLNDGFRNGAQRGEYKATAPGRAAVMTTFGK